MCAVGERLLLVPIFDGTGDLDRSASLDGLARDLWHKLVAGVPPDELAAQVAFDTGISSERADADVRAFVADLAARGLIAQDAPPNTTRVAGEALATGASTTSGEPLGSFAIDAVARAVLDRGCKLRFTARGLSMRPRLPHGSILEVSPRTFGNVRVGDVALYSTSEHRMVAHRIIARRGETMLARGDSAARLDSLDAAALLGVVTARVANDGTRRRLDHGSARAFGLLSGISYRCAVATVRVFGVLPLKKIRVLRRSLRFGLGAASRLMRIVEDRMYRWRRHADVGRAALLTAEEKNDGRRDLYAEKSVQDFTALDENVEAGLTMIEDLLLRRHPIAPGPALVVGCGPGRECVALARRGFEVTGLDREEGMLVRARALTAREELDIRFVRGEADAFDLPGETFETVVVFSGLYNMLLPRSRRVDLLRAALKHLAPGGRVLLTFLSDYAKPGRPETPEVRTFWSAVNPDHQEGDLYLLNEAVHIFPHVSRLLTEAREAGFEIETVFRDQRAYDKAKRQVRGYTILVRPK